MHRSKAVVLRGRSVLPAASSTGVAPAWVSLMQVGFEPPALSPPTEHAVVFTAVPREGLIRCRWPDTRTGARRCTGPPRQYGPLPASPVPSWFR